MNYSLAVSALTDEILKTLSVKIPLTASADNYDLNVLLTQINRVYRKVFTQYVDIRRTGEAEFSDGVAELSAVAESLIGEDYTVLKVEKVSKNGRKLRFEVKDGRIFCEKAGNSAEVTATVICDKTFEYADSLPLPNAAFRQIMVDGAAAEYAAVRGMPQEAAYYKSCFESGIFNLTRDGKYRVIPERRFV